MTLGVVMPRKLALYMDRTKVVMANDKRPRGDGLPSLCVSLAHILDCKPDTLAVIHRECWVAVIDRVSARGYVPRDGITIPVPSAGSRAAEITARTVAFLHTGTVLYRALLEVVRCRHCVFLVLMFVRCERRSMWYLVRVDGPVREDVFLYLAHLCSASPYLPRMGPGQLVLERLVLWQDYTRSKSGWSSQIWQRYRQHLGSRIPDERCQGPCVSVQGVLLSACLQRVLTRRALR